MADFVWWRAFDRIVPRCAFLFAPRRWLDAIAIPSQKLYVCVALMFSKVVCLAKESPLRDCYTLSLHYLRVLRPNARLQQHGSCHRCCHRVDELRCPGGCRNWNQFALTRGERDSVGGGDGYG